MARTLSCLLLVLAGCGGGPVAQGLPRPASVLLVAIDGLRTDQIGAYQGAEGVTPNLDQLAREGVRYTDVATPAPWTSPALASLLSGRYPSSMAWTDLERPLPYGVTLLPEHLAGAGYLTGAVVSHHHAAARFNLDQGFESYHEVGFESDGETDDGVAPSSAAQVTGRALSILASAGARPFCLLVHYADPLPPWDLPEEVLDPSYVGPVEAGLSMRDLTRVSRDLRPEDRSALARLHDASVAQVDSELGRLLEGLELQGRMEDTYVCVVATSGLELGDHGELGTAKRLYDELVHVPWVLAGPALAPTILEEAASLIDVTPTLLELLGAEPLPIADGAAVLPNRPPPERLLVSETDRARCLRAVTVDRWKLIHDQETGVSELYDLLSDPGETRDLAGKLPTEVDRLKAFLDRWEASLAVE